jgi:hypothetical protein
VWHLEEREEISERKKLFKEEEQKYRRPLQRYK